MARSMTLLSVRRIGSRQQPRKGKSWRTKPLLRMTAVAVAVSPCPCIALLFYLCSGYSCSYKHAARCLPPLYNSVLQRQRLLLYQEPLPPTNLTLIGEASTTTTAAVLVVVVVLFTILIAVIGNNNRWRNDDYDHDVNNKKGPNSPPGKKRKLNVMKALTLVLTIPYVHNNQPCVSTHLVGLICI